MGVVETEEFSGRWWTDKSKLIKAIELYGSNTAIQNALNVNESTIRKWRERHGLGASADRGAATPTGIVRAPITGDVEGVDPEAVLKLLQKNSELTIEELSDHFDCAPRVIRSALDVIGENGYRLGEEERGIFIQKPDPSTHNVHAGLFEGKTMTFGVVSDTHLSSKEEALPELHLAYEMFEKEGIETVFHAGDLNAGRGIYRTQDSEIKTHTLDGQVEYAIENYPKIEGIKTYIIGGNHDLEGLAGRVGFDPVAAFAKERDDVEYLGPYSAWIGTHGGSWIHLMHGAGGMSYAYSYKAQKLVDGYPGGRKPAMLIVGHWHVEATLTTRSVKVMFPGCFEWQSYFMQRRGLQPAVGFHIVDATFGDDGSLVQTAPRWYQFFEGRTIS